MTFSLDHSESNCTSSRPGYEYAQLLDMLPLMAMVADSGGNVLLVNRFAREWFGYSEADWEGGIHCTRLVHPAYRDKVMKALLDVLQEREIVWSTFQGMRRDGTSFGFRLAPRRIAVDGSAAVLCLAFPGEENQPTETSRYRSEKYYRSLFESTGTATVIVGGDARILSCNMRFAELVGYPVEEMETRMHWTDFVASSDVERMQKLYRQRSLFPDQTPHDYEFTLVGRGGRRRHVRLYVDMIPGTDDRVASLVDLTAQHRSEAALRKSRERYELVVRGANDGIWDWDLTTDSVYFSPRYKQILGYADSEFPNHADSWKSHVHPDDLALAMEANIACIKGEKRQFEVEYRMRHKDGSYRWILGRGASSRDESGKVYRLAGTHTDMTQRKRTEAALRDSELRHSALSNATFEAIVLSEGGYCIEANQSACDMIGCELDEFVGTNVLDWLDEGSRDVVRRHMSMDYSPPYEALVRRKDGSLFPVQIQGRVFPYKDKLIRASAVRDISEWKRAEQKYHAIFERANDGIYQATPEGVILTANPAMARILGYSTPEELMSRVRNIGIQCYHDPSLRNHVMSRLRDSGSIDQLEVELRRTDGRKIWVSASLKGVIGAGGELTHYEGFLRDITERKLNERTSLAMYKISRAVSTTRNLEDLYRTIYEILTEAVDTPNFYIALLDEENDRIVFPFFCDEKDEMLAINDVSRPGNGSVTLDVIRTGKPIFLTRDQCNEGMARGEMHVVGTLAAVWIGVPLRINGKTRGCMTVQHYHNPNHYSESDVNFMVAVSEQVALAIERKSNEEKVRRLNSELEVMVEQRTSELRQRTAELEQANARLKELDRIKSTLISSISHELRTPLTSIRGFAKLAGRDFSRYFMTDASLDELAVRKGNRISDNLEIIETEGMRLTRLINDFLDLNRIESGKETWHDLPLDPVVMVKQAVNAVRGQFSANPNLSLVTDLPAELPAIHADPDKIQQVLLNLLGNAYKFTPCGSVTVSAKADASMLTVIVADTGTGIPGEDLPRIFERFHKATMGDTLRHTTKGTGLGLAICKEIVAHYGGVIWVESELGRGSEFSFTLPLHQGN